jgi:predicted RNase H-like HicB family nuclease
MNSLDEDEQFLREAIQRFVAMLMAVGYSREEALQRARELLERRTRELMERRSEDEETGERY